MASKLPTLIQSSTRALRHTASPLLHNTPVITSRTFRSSTRRLQDVTAAAAGGALPLPVQRPVGAFRGGIFGFLLGSTLAGAATYYYILEEYRVSNELLTEDIYALQAAVQKIHTYVASLEEKMDAMEKRKK